MILRDQTEKDVDITVLKLSVKKLSEQFDTFIGECIDQDNKPKAPTYKSLMRARGYLPSYCKNTLNKG